MRMELFEPVNGKLGSLVLFSASNLLQTFAFSWPSSRAVLNQEIQKNWTNKSISSKTVKDYKIVQSQKSKAKIIQNKAYHFLSL